MRWRLGPGRNAEWLAELAEEEADAAHLAAVATPPPEACIPPGCRDIVAAFIRLADDRPRLLALLPLPDGGVTVRHLPRRISFAQIDRYAHRYGVADPEEFDIFRRLIEAMDDEALKAEAEDDS